MPWDSPQGVRVSERSGVLDETVEAREGCVASATDTQSHNQQCSAKNATGHQGCLSNLTLLIRQARPSPRQGPGGNACMLVCWAGHGSISTIASVCDCLNGRFHYFNWMPSSASRLLCTCFCALGHSFFTP